MVIALRINADEMGLDRLHFLGVLLDFDRIERVSPCEDSDALLITFRTKLLYGSICLIGVVTDEEKTCILGDGMVHEHIYILRVIDRKLFGDGGD